MLQDRGRPGEMQRERESETDTDRHRQAGRRSAKHPHQHAVRYGVREQEKERVWVNKYARMNTLKIMGRRVRLVEQIARGPDDSPERLALESSEQSPCFPPPSLLISLYASLSLPKP
jgi:hypothetical protein